MKENRGAPACCLPPSGKAHPPEDSPDSEHNMQQFKHSGLVSQTGVRLNQQLYLLHYLYYTGYLLNWGQQT